MRAVILCPGPSLASLAKLPVADVVIGINRACLRFPCHWWAALDFQTFVRDESFVRGDPLLLTRAPYRPKYTDRVGIDVEDINGPPVAFDMFSSTAALVLARSLGSTSIGVYGADWTEAADFDGVQPPEAARHAGRWAIEAKLWGDVSTWLADLGTTVTRH